jgi:NADPH:quinone reductase-like Zn-dependent oxidoreductase
MIPSGTRLTAFHSDNLKGSAGTTVLRRVVREVEAGVYRPNVDRVFGLDDIVAAHQYMEGNQAAGKLVMVPGAPPERELRPCITRRRRGRKGIMG